VVLAKRPGHVATAPYGLQTEEEAWDALDRLFGDPGVRSVQYGLAELQIVEQYR
jgi:hypothetical protein